MAKDDQEINELTAALADLDITYRRVRNLLEREIRRHRNEEESPERPVLFEGYNL